ncbi:hypothetical protein R69919_05492 [Paraburkholderia gardini]|nr:hypothetical protein R69919_05492 [Paraburkholderia gardini]
MALRFVTMAGAEGVTSDLLHARATREWSVWTTGYLALVDEAEAGFSATESICRSTSRITRPTRERNVRSAFLIRLYCFACA